MPDILPGSTASGLNWHAPARCSAARGGVWRSRHRPPHRAAASGVPAAVLRRPAADGDNSVLEACPGYYGDRLRRMAIAAPEADRLFKIASGERRGRR